MRQLLTESLLLSLAGGALGLLVAFWASDVIASFYAADIEGRRAYFVLGLDPTVLAFATAASVATGILFGLTPAIESSRPDLARTMRAAAPGARASGSRLRDGLVVSQIALSLTLVTGAGLLRSQPSKRLTQARGSIRVRSCSSVSAPRWSGTRRRALSPSSARRFDASSRCRGSSRRARRTCRRFPAGATTPRSGSPAASPRGPPTRCERATNAVGPRYFETMGIAAARGARLRRP